MRVSRLCGFALDVLAVALAVLFFAAAIPPALQRTCQLLQAEAALAGESLTASRARMYGPAYVQAIDQIRAAIDPDEPYLLVEAGGPRQGGVYWVRYDLAPRRAIFLGRLDELTPRDLRRNQGANLRHVVVALGPGPPPRLFDRFAFRDLLDRRAAAIGSDGQDAAPPNADKPLASGSPPAAATPRPTRPSTGGAPQDTGPPSADKPPADGTPPAAAARGRAAAATAPHAP
jgi:hypothetical protein